MDAVYRVGQKCTQVQVAPIGANVQYVYARIICDKNGESITKIA